MACEAWPRTHVPVNLAVPMSLAKLDNFPQRRAIQQKFSPGWAWYLLHCEGVQMCGEVQDAMSDMNWRTLSVDRRQPQHAAAVDPIQRPCTRQPCIT